MKFRLILLLSIISSSAYAESWQCRNDIEIRCSEGKCAAEKINNFTPMSVSFNDLGKMSVCAYSGCWEGTGKVMKSDGFLFVIGKNLKFSTSPDPADMRQDIAISLDRNDNVAMLKAGEFAHPLVCESKPPTFDEYKVRIYRRNPRPIVFRGNREARMFRTRLRNARRGGVNFAGHFIYASWGCGTGCLYGAIINARTGRVYFPKEFKGVGFGVGGAAVADEPIQYQKDSKLFILSGTAANANRDGTTYLVWEETRFRQVKFVPSKN